MKKSNLVFVLGVGCLGRLFQSCVEKAGNKNEGKESTEVKNVLRTVINLEKQDIQNLTNKNMHNAYIGKTTALFKNAVYPKKSAEEGHPDITLIYKAAYRAEIFHAKNYKVVLTGRGEAIPKITTQFTVNSKAENIKETVGGENYEFNTMCPNFIKDANAEETYLAHISLTYAYRVEEKHKDFYEGALTALEAGIDKILAKVYSLCFTCGNTYASKAPNRFEISMTDSKPFIKVQSL
jgi:rubrerythrin